LFTLASAFRGNGGAVGAKLSERVRLWRRWRQLSKWTARTRFYRWDRRLQLRRGVLPRTRNSSRRRLRVPFGEPIHRIRSTLGRLFCDGLRTCHPMADVVPAAPSVYAALPQLLLQPHRQHQWRLPGMRDGDREVLIPAHWRGG